ncbi:hypothetical protein [Eoetvoesiella caeni]|uniref:Uncharacterized protein n=1 Tax=Eoetvoesiella caeni TaxID=645616 RepID=A0A366H3P7_9BURK|nr:hypothetical protein [Eoetvoesiella caeni]MCI2810968.1 hypothetical protein [Eoetvoesiella caeni]NYT56867.1 hypothetical protein [Eoetvoesiella caeni]RBP35434.1 hypothetical protein DFR37_11738 [Eoetvoesiella caeni]
MNGLIEFSRKLGRLFVDDGTLAIALIGWCLAAGLLLPAFAPHSVWSAPLFSLGCLLILIANVTCSAAQHKK